MSKQSPLAMYIVLLKSLVRAELSASLSNYNALNRPAEHVIAMSMTSSATVPNIPSGCQGNMLCMMRCAVVKLQLGLAKPALDDPLSEN